MSDAVRINGHQYDWASIELRINGEPFSGFKSINFKQSRERGKMYGAGKAYGPRGRGRGKYSCEGSAEFWTDSANDIRKALADSNDGVNYGDVVFQITVQYVETNNSEPVTIELIDCVIGAEDSSNAEGTDGLSENWDLDIMYMKKNGLTLFYNDGSI